MDLSNFHPTEIVQLPAIIKSGIVDLLSPDLAKLDDTTLKQIAALKGGELAYIKMRATYTGLPPNEALCITKDCWRPAAKDKDYCDSHGASTN